jgi:hypothetical protein
MSAASDCIRLRIDNLVVFEIMALTGISGQKQVRTRQPEECSMPIANLWRQQGLPGPTAGARPLKSQRHEQERARDGG